MKVYILSYGYHVGGMMGYDHHEVLGTFSSIDSVKKELDKIKGKFLEGGPGFKIQDNEDGSGFCGYHEMGSMSFTPGYWKFEEQEVRD